MAKRRRGSGLLRPGPGRPATCGSTGSSIAPSPASRRRFARRSTRSRWSSPTTRPPEQLRENGLGPDETLYGLYEGVPRSEWGADWVPMPSRILVFRLPLEEDFPDPDDLADEVRITILHELAHHLGIDDEDHLAELGID